MRPQCCPRFIWSAAGWDGLLTFLLVVRDVTFKRVLKQKIPPHLDHKLQDFLGRDLERLLFCEE